MKQKRLPFNPQRPITQEDRLQFAVRFAQMDLETLRAGDWLNLREDVGGFMMLGPHAQPYSTKPLTSIELGETTSPYKIFQPLLSMGMIGIKQPETPDVPEWSLDDFRTLQADVRALFDALTHPPNPGGSYLPAFVDIQGRLSLVRGSSPGVAYAQVIAPVRDLFLWHLLWLLLAEPPDRIQRCPECATIFYRVKKQAYCSRTCGNRATQRRWRERHEVSAPTAE